MTIPVSPDPVDRDECVETSESHARNGLAGVDDDTEVVDDGVQARAASLPLKPSQREID